MLKNGRSQEAVEAIKELCRNKKLETERDYSVCSMGRMLYSDVAEKSLPIGSDSVGSPIRGVVNLRLKGASLFRLKETLKQLQREGRKGRRRALKGNRDVARWRQRNHLFSV